MAATIYEDDTDRQGVGARGKTTKWRIIKLAIGELCLGIEAPYARFTPRRVVSQIPLN